MASARCRLMNGRSQSSISPIPVKAITIDPGDTAPSMFTNSLKVFCESLCRKVMSPS